MNFTIEIDRQQIIDNLARTTGYIGAKNTDSDPKAFDRVALNEGDTKLIDRFFRECREQLSLALRHQLESENIVGDIYRLVLSLSSAFDKSLLQSVQSGIANFFVQSIASKWLGITDSARAAEYAEAAKATLDYIIRKIYYKRKPQRPNL